MGGARQIDRRAHGTSTSQVLTPNMTKTQAHGQ